MLPIGSKVLDFSYSRPPALKVKELGYDGGVGYVSLTAGKNITKAECLAFIAAGLTILLVFELTATRPNGGAEKGKIDGATAKAQALALGYPSDIPVLTAVDTNTSTALGPTHEAYVRAFAAAVSPYPCGVYCDTDLWRLVNDVCVVGWMPNAWAWSDSSREKARAEAKAIGMHVLQDKGFWIEDKWAVDPNTVISPIPAWGVASPLPTSEDDDVQVFIKSESNDHPVGAGAIWEATLGGKIHIGEWYYNAFQEAQLKNPAVKVFDLILMTNAQIDAIPDVPVGGNAGSGGGGQTLKGTFNVPSIPGSAAIVLSPT